MYSCYKQSPAGIFKWASARLIAHVCVATLISACASSGQEDDTQVRYRFSSIAIVSRAELVAVESVDTGSLSKTEMTVAGGATGALGGAMAGAAVCAPTGPYAAICIAAAVVPGAIAGLVGGALTANALWFSGVSQEEELYLKEEASHLSAKRDIHGELAQTLKEKLPPDLTAPVPEADVQAIPIIKEIMFVAADDEMLQLKVSAMLVFSEVGEVDSVRKGHFMFSAKSSHKPLDDWLTLDGSAMANAMDKCLSDISDDMARLIVERRSR